MLASDVHSTHVSGRQLTAPAAACRPDRCLEQEAFTSEAGGYATHGHFRALAVRRLCRRQQPSTHFRALAVRRLCRRQQPSTKGRKPWERKRTAKPIPATTERT